MPPRVPIYISEHNFIRVFIVHHAVVQKIKLYKKIKSYMCKVQITQEQLLYLSKEQIRKKINEWNTKQRRESMESKFTLNIYREYKGKNLVFK